MDYIAEYQGMSDDEVKSHIMPLLVPGGGAYVNIPIPTPSRRRASPPHAKRGTRFFGSSDNTQYMVYKMDPFFA